MRFLTQHLCPGSKGWRVCLALFITSTLMLAASLSQAQPQRPGLQKIVRSLPLGKTVKARITYQEFHYYELALEKGQPLQIQVLQDEGHVNLSFQDQTGKTLANDDSRLHPGTKQLALVVEQSGLYQVLIFKPFVQETGGQYTLEATIPSTITPTFLARATAYKLSEEFTNLYGQQSFNPSKGLLRQIVQKGQELVTVLQAAGDLAGEMQMLYLLGDVYKTLGEMQTARQTLDRAIQFARQTRNSFKIAEFLNTLGQTHVSLSDYPRALAAYEEALPLWAQSSGGTPQNLVAWNLTNIAAVQNLMGEKQKAIAYHQRAYQIYKDHYQGEDARQESERGLGIATNHLGAVYLSMGEKQKAIDLHRQAFAHFQASGDVGTAPSVLNRLGEAYASLGEPRTALAFFQQALTGLQKNDEPQAEASVRNNLGRVQAALGAYDTALENLSHALTIRRKIGDRRGQALSLTNLGSIKTAQGQHQPAIHLQQEALSLWREIGERYGEAYSLHYLGLSHYALHERRKAAEYFAQALHLRRAVGDREGEADSLFNLARLERDENQLAPARDRIKAALALTESVRTSIFSQELRASYLATVRDYYEFYVELLMQWHEREPAAGFAAQALEAAEKAKARSMLETLVEAGGDIREGVPTELLAQERALQQRLNAKAEYQIRLQNSKPAPEQSQAVAQEIQNLTVEYQEVRSRIRATSPRYAALTQPQPLTVQEIQQQLLDENTLLLEYALGEERSWLWVVSPTSIKTFALPRRAEIEKTARHFYQLLTVRNQFLPNESAPQRRIRLQQADVEFSQIAAALSGMILAPAAAELGRKRLLLVTQGALQYVPFAALPEPRKSQPLVINHELVSLPSASILALLRREEAKRRPTPKTIAVFADPVFSAGDERVQTTRTSPLRKAVTVNATPQKQDVAAPISNPLLRALEDFHPENSNPTVRIARLSGTRWEAEKIGAFVPATQRLVALDFNASRHLAVSGELSQYRIVHFASHAFINTIHPELSGIVLSLVDKQGNPQDGFLRANEIYNLKLPAELVVLSACQTGLGKDVKGEGLIGLTQSFMYAGAPRIVVSLWSLQDKATAELMARFYQRMLGKEKLAPAAALRAAQVEMWRMNRLPSPYFWAGFILQGEYR